MKKLSGLCNRANLKPAIILPLLLFLFLTLGGVLWYIGPNIQAAGAGQALTTAIGREPKRAQLRSFLFHHPLQPVGNADADPDDALFLAGLLEDSRKAFYEEGRDFADKPSLRRSISKATAEELEAFVEAKPLSTWTPSVRNQLGVYYVSRGATTRALEHWRTVWEMTAAIEEPTSRQAADFALAHYARELVLLGHTDLLNDIFAQHENRILTGGLHGHWLRTKEKHIRMIKYPHQGYKCGVYALDQIALALGLEHPRGDLLNVRSKKEGFSLAELEAIAADFGIGVVSVERLEDSSSIPVPAVIHWKQEHYAAIVAQTGEVFKIVDPSAAGVLYLTAEEINEEASGFFLLPSNFNSADFGKLPLADASRVYGKASGCPPEDWEDGCGGEGGGSGSSGGGSSGGGGRGSRGGLIGAAGGSSSCSSCGDGGSSGGGGPDGGSPGSGCDSCTNSVGMVSWRISEPYLNILLTDTPLFYKPSKGPEVALTLKYKESGSLFSPSYGFGFKVSHPWQSMVAPDPNGISDQITFPGPTQLTFDFGTATNTIARNFKSSALLERTFASGFVDGYYLYYPDGTQWHYETEFNGKFYLNKIVAPDGYALTISRNTSVHAERIATITDGDGGVVTFDYDDPTYDYLVTSVTAPGGRVASFQYYVSQYAWSLTGITDAAGIVCTLGYDSSFGIQLRSVTTPYGTTQFEQPYIGYSSYDRATIVTHPTGAREAYLLIDSYTGGYIPNFESWQLPSNTPFATNGYDYGTIETTDRGERNTFYWNAQQYASLSNTNIGTMTWAELKRARIRHWLWKLSPDLYNHVDTLNHEQMPSPDDGATEGAITWYDYDGKDYASPQMRGSRREPAVIARVQPDGTTWWTHYKRNDWGRAYEEIERWVQDGSERRRTNTYVWSGDGIDLLAHWFSSSEGTHLKVGYGYDSGNHSPVRITNSLDEITYLTYTNNRLLTVDYPSGHISSNVYSGNDIVHRVDFLGSQPFRSESFTWTNQLVKTHTDFRGLVTTNHYDKLNRLTKIEYPNPTGTNLPGTNIVYAYTNGAGTMMLHRTYMRNEVGAETKWEYNSMGTLSKEVDPLGRITAYGYCDCGSLHSITNAVGSGLEVVTSFVYDDQGNLTETYRTGGINSTNVYDMWRRPVIQRDALASRTNVYDNLSRLVQVKSAFGQLSRSIYDNDNMVRTNIDANGVSTIMTYDDLHRVQSQILLGGGTNIWEYPDYASGPTNHVNELGKVTQYAYNALGWKMSEVFVGVSANIFTYNEAGDLLTLSDGKNQVTTWGYDAFGRVTNKLNAANTQVFRYSYHPNGALSNRWTAAKGNTIYSYDAVGNLTNVNYAASTDIKFKYDAMNRVTNMVDAAGTTTNYYDVASRLMIEKGPWTDARVTNRWNTAGLPESISVQQPSTTNYFHNAYTYDAARRLKTVSGTAGSFTNHYHAGLNSITAPSRLIQQMGLANSAYITNDYDSLARLTSTKLKNGGTHAELNRHDYVYNHGHQRTQQSRKDGDYVDYLYDDVGQLYSAKTYSSNHVETTSQRRGYTYDPAWNLTKTTNNTLVTTRTVNNLNQITAGDSSYTYDANGNRITGANYQTYLYDDENQLTQRYNDASFYSGSTRTDFTYDGKGRLRRRTESTWIGGGGQSPWSTVSETRYIYSGMLVVQERDGSNTPEVSYTRGSDLSGTLEGAGGIGGLLARSHGYSAGTWSTHNFYHSDANGNITMMLDASKASVATYKYDPYGNLLSSSGTLSAANLYRFSSKLWCANAGLYYYGYRFYDPSLQRWLNEDPFGERGGKNLHSFAFNQPSTRIDGLGLSSCEVSVECRRLGNDPEGTSKGKASGFFYGLLNGGHPATHCSAVVDKGNGNTRRYELGEGPNADQGPVDPTDDRWTNYPTAPTGAFTPTGTCSSHCDCVEQSAQPMLAAAPPYNLLGPNSNTYINSLLGVCGLTVTPYTIGYSAGVGHGGTLTMNAPMGAIGW